MKIDMATQLQLFKEINTRRNYKEKKHTLSSTA